MTFPLGTQILTTNVENSAGDPSLARNDIYNLIVAVNRIIDSANSESGVLVLDNNGKITSSRMPSTIATSSGDVTLTAGSGVININNVLKLAGMYTADLGSSVGTTSPVAGNLCYLVDGDVGQPCIGVYDGTKWRVVRLMTQVGNVGAALSSTFTVVATPTL
jgi:hypothetical protein